MLRLMRRAVALASYDLQIVPYLSTVTSSLMACWRSDGPSDTPRFNFRRWFNSACVPLGLTACDRPDGLSSLLSENFRNLAFSLQM